MPDLGDIIKNGAKNVGKGLKKETDLAQKRGKLHWYIKGILPTPRRLTSVVNKARTARRNWKAAEKRVYDKFKKNTQFIVNGLSNVSKFAFESAGILVGKTADLGLRLLGPDEGTKIYRNGTKAVTRMLAKGAHGLTHLSLLGLRGISGKVFVRVKTTQQRNNYKNLKNAALASM